MWLRSYCRDVARWMLRLARTAMAALLVIGAGCVQEMANQPRYEPLEPPGDQTGEVRPPLAPVPGTVARGHLDGDDAYLAGRDGEGFVDEVPERVLAGRGPGQLAERGRDRFEAICSHCHGRVGGGSGGDGAYQSLVGMVVRAGYPMPPTFHQARLREVPLGHFVNVIAKGLGRMPRHDYLAPPDDRWAIAAYIRALQVSQFVPAGDLAPADLAALQASEPENRQ